MIYSSLNPPGSRKCSNHAVRRRVHAKPHSTQSGHQIDEHVGQLLGQRHIARMKNSKAEISIDSKNRSECPWPSTKNRWRKVTNQDSKRNVSSARPNLAVAHARTRSVSTNFIIATESASSHCNGSPDSSFESMSVRRPS